MVFKILSPEEAKKRAKANVAEWLRKKEKLERLGINRKQLEKYMKDAERHISDPDFKMTLIIQLETNSMNKLFMISKTITTLGRSSENNIVLKDGLVSKKHAKILLDSEGGKIFIEDLGSTNGTHVLRKNSRIIVEKGLLVELKNEDIVFLGNNVSFSVKGILTNPNDIEYVQSKTNR